MKRALVTGACGFIGTALTNRLTELGWSVVGLDDYSTGGSVGLPLSVPVVAHDVSRPFPPLPHFDVLFHLAALSRIRMCEGYKGRAWAVNFHGVFNAVLAAERCDAKVVFTSTCAASEPSLSVYAASKRSAEELLRVAPIPVAVVRPFNVYGNGYGSVEPSDGPASTVVARFLAAREYGEELVVHGTGEQRRDFVHVCDVVDALVLCATTGTNVAHYEIGTGTNYSVSEVAQMVGGRVRRVDRPENEQEVTLADPLRLLSLGWRPRYNLPEYVASRVGVEV